MAPLSVTKHILILVGLLCQVFATPFLSDGDSHPLDAREPDSSGNDINAWMQFFGKRSAIPYNTSEATDSLVKREKATLTDYYAREEMWPLRYTKNNKEEQEAMKLVYLKSAFRVQLAAAPYRSANIERGHLPRRIDCPAEHEFYCQEMKALARTEIIFVLKNEGAPKTTVIVVRSEELKKIFVIFRGTANFNNKKIDIRYWSTRVHQDAHGMELCERCLIHKGFYLFTTQVLDQLDQLFCVSVAKMPWLEKPLLQDEKYHGYDIEIIGHSLGAAAAQILTQIWRHRRREGLVNNCFWGRSIGNSNFGSPVVGNINFAENLANSALRGSHAPPNGAINVKKEALKPAIYKDFNHRWAHHWDPVPCVPPRNLPPIYTSMVQIRRLWFNQEPKYVHAPPEIFIDTGRNVWQSVTEENFPEYLSVRPGINGEKYRDLKVPYDHVRQWMNFHRSYIHGGNPGGISFGEDQGQTPPASAISSEDLESLNGHSTPLERTLDREMDAVEHQAGRSGHPLQGFPE